MKYFEKDGRYNFIDDNNVLVGFDSSQGCCESFGFYFATAETNKSNEDYQPTEFEDYYFDVNYFKELSLNSGDGGGVVIFKLLPTKKKKNPMYLHIFNDHNGYYSHGFEMKINGKDIYEGSL
jgi:hypothetical protein